MMLVYRELDNLPRKAREVIPNRRARSRKAEAPKVGCPVRQVHIEE